MLLCKRLKQSAVHSISVTELLLIDCLLATYRQATETLTDYLSGNCIHNPDADNSHIRLTA